MNFLGGAVRLGQVAGITVRVHVLFFLLAGYWLVTAEDWRFELLFAALLFVIVLVHEFGHCLGARSVGGYAHDILMWPLGGLAFAHAPMRAWPQFVTVACGPLVNVVFCVVSGVLVLTSTGERELVSLYPQAGIWWNPHHWQSYVHIFFRINYMLLVFNLLPIFPLDGGQLLRSIIWPLVGFQRATMLAAQLGIVGAIVLGVWGVKSGQFMLIAIAIFGGSTSFQHLQAARHGLLVEDERVGAVLPGRRGGPGLWARLFGRGDVHPARPAQADAAVNPNPGAWDARQEEKRRLEAEVDRILKKVHAEGIRSLTYVERQTLERATRERQQTESEFQRENTL